MVMEGIVCGCEGGAGGVWYLLVAYVVVAVRCCCFLSILFIDVCITTQSTSYSKQEILFVNVKLKEIPYVHVKLREIPCVHVKLREIPCVHVKLKEIPLYTSN